MGPIIEEERIDLTGFKFQNKNWTAKFGFCLYSDDNPLKAAAIVYLMMKDNKEEISEGGEDENN